MKRVNFRCETTHFGKFRSLTEVFLQDFVFLLNSPKVNSSRPLTARIKVKIIRGVAYLLKSCGIFLSDTVDFCRPS